MKWLFRPSLLIVLSAAFVVGAAALFFLPQPGLSRPQPLPVAPGDQEVVWLYAATNSSAWERFVAAVQRTAERLRSDQPGLRAEVSEATFPRQTTAVPELALSWPGPGGRLRFRWYKLTSDWNTRDWVEALLARQPPPLAIIGGSSSDGARELALQLNRVAANLPEARRPLLLLTTATADRVLEAQGPSGTSPADRPALVGDEAELTPGINLNRVYPDRTFRFCFTNKQMAAAVMHFIWSRPELRPDSDPVYTAQWEDDSYSYDLIEGFGKAIRGVLAMTAAREWAWASAQAHSRAPGLGGVLPLERAGKRASSFALDVLPIPGRIDSSVGAFAWPNRYEAKVAQDQVDLLVEQHPGQRRALLVVPGQTQPSRRFLRAVARSAPDACRRFVVATGDAIAFNTIYRDRLAAWPVQDFPFALVLFCHHNPVDRGAGFRPVPDPAALEGGELPAADGGTAATGTEDILLYIDIVEALAGAFRRPGRPCADAAELRAGLAAARLLPGDRIGYGAEGTPLFSPSGRRANGTGEHVVCLLPHFKDSRIPPLEPGEPPLDPRVLPEATIEVWAWRAAPGGRLGPARYWERCGEPLRVSYVDFQVEGGGHDRPR